MAVIKRANGVLRRIRIKPRPGCLPNEEDASRTDNEAALAVEETRASLKNNGFAAGYFPLHPGADLGKSNSDLGKSDSALSKSDSDLGKSGSDLSKSNLDLGKSDSDLGKSGSDLGISGADLGKSNLDLGKSGSDLGKSGSGSVVFFLARGAHIYSKPTVRRNQNGSNG